MKLRESDENTYGWIVAPLAGAWIEILTGTSAWDKPTVAPLAGAWIEISSYGEAGMNVAWSLPLRERGLKSLYDYQEEAVKASLPLRERGLKLSPWTLSKGGIMSLPLRERGLKFLRG